MTAIPTHVKTILTDRAVERFGREIRLISGKSIDESCDVFGDRYVFWFNTPDESTHVVSIFLWEIDK
jgi:hypothetical protein